MGTKVADVDALWKSRFRSAKISTSFPQRIALLWQELRETCGLFRNAYYHYKQLQLFEKAYRSNSRGLRLAAEKSEDGMTMTAGCTFPTCDCPGFHCRLTGDVVRGRLTPEEKRTQGSLFGQEMKDRALDKAEYEHASDLQAARLIRDRIALERGTVDADAVREVFEKHRGGEAWGPWAGALFRDRRYETTGEFKASTFATNHGAVIRVWRMKR